MVVVVVVTFCLAFSRQCYCNLLLVLNWRNIVCSCSLTCACLMSGDTLPTRTKRIDPSQFMLYPGGAGSQSQLQQRATGSQPQLSSPSRPPPLSLPAQPVSMNSGPSVEPWVDICTECIAVMLKYYNLIQLQRRSGSVSRASDLWPQGHVFESRPATAASYLHLCVFVTKKYNLVLV